MTDFVLSAKLVDKFGNASTLRWPYTVSGADFGADSLAAQTALNALVAGLNPLTTAVIAETKITTINSTDATAPPDNSTLGDKALINCFRAAPNQGKTAPIYIPSPDSSLFLSGSKTVNVSLANLHTYLFALELYAKFSDGESFDSSQGTNGIDNGRWLSASRK